MKRQWFHLFRLSVLSVQLSVLAVCCGCVDRSLMIRSDPSGATVAVNGVEAGVTPVRMEFTTYGMYEMVAAAPHCQRLRTKVPVLAPWYETMGLDFFAEVLWPFTLHDDHEVTLTLTPIQPGVVPGLDEREQQLRERAMP